MILQRSLVTTLAIFACSAFADTETNDAKDTRAEVITAGQEQTAYQTGWYIDGVLEDKSGESPAINDVDVYVLEGLIPYHRYTVEITIEELSTDAMIAFVRSNGFVHDTSVSGGYNGAPQHTWRADSNGSMTLAIATSSDTNVDGGGVLTSGKYAVQVRPENNEIVHPADLTGDGVVDNSDTGQIVVLYTAGSPLADFNADGVLDNGDLVEYISGAFFEPAPDVADADGDRIPDYFEDPSIPAYASSTYLDCEEYTYSAPLPGYYVGPYLTNTNPCDCDTDGDGIDDGEEVIGTVLALPLPTMGADPMKKSVFLEIDWHEGDLQGSSGTEQKDYSYSSLITDRISEIYEDSPVLNPGIEIGINLFIDAGFGYPFLNGGKIYRMEYLQVDDGNGGVIVQTSFFDEVPNVEVPKADVTSFPTPEFPGTLVADPTFGDYKAQFHNDRRVGYFRYALSTHLGPAIGNAEIPGDSDSLGAGPLIGDDLQMGFDKVGSHLDELFVWDDFTDSQKRFIKLHVLFHELGHNMGLLHNGFQGGSNNKPNYNSAMNRRFSFMGSDNNYDGWPDADQDRSTFLEDADTSPNDGDPRTEVEIAWDNLDYSREKLPDLDECDLDERKGVLNILSAQDINWDDQSQVVISGDPTYGLSVNHGLYSPTPFQIGVTVPCNINCSGPPSPDVPNDNCTVLVGHNDWANLIFIPTVVAP